MLLFRRNTLEYVGVRCDECADARDSGPPSDLAKLGWKIGHEHGSVDLCPQCNPEHPVGRRELRRSADRAEEMTVDGALFRTGSKA
jgi:hypothetical protein